MPDAAPPPPPAAGYAAYVPQPPAPAQMAPPPPPPAQMAPPPPPPPPPQMAPPPPPAQRPAAAMPAPAPPPKPMPAPAPVARRGPTEFRRPSGSPFITRLGAELPEGSIVHVGVGDAFYGIRHGGCEVVLEKGKHTLEDELDDGFFILTGGIDVAFDHDLGVLTDNHAGRAKVTIRGNVRVTVDEARDLVAEKASVADALDVPALEARVRTKMRELVQEEIHDLLAKDRRLISLSSSKMTEEIKKEVKLRWGGDVDRDAFIAIDLVKLFLKTETVFEEEKPPESVASDDWSAKPAEPPAPVGPPPRPSLDPGVQVEVVWHDGQKYPATVRSPGVLVAFGDGQEHWVPLDRIGAPYGTG